MGWAGAAGEQSTYAENFMGNEASYTLLLPAQHTTHTHTQPRARRVNQYLSEPRQYEKRGDVRRTAMHLPSKRQPRVYPLRPKRKASVAIRLKKQHTTTTAPHSNFPPLHKSNLPRERRSSLYFDQQAFLHIETLNTSHVPPLDNRRRARATQNQPPSNKTIWSRNRTTQLRLQTLLTSTNLSVHVQSTIPSPSL